MKGSFFWDVMPCSLLKVKRYFGGTCLSYLKPSYLLHACFLLDLFIDSEDGGDMFIRNFNFLSTEYTELYSRRQNSSTSKLAQGSVQWQTYVNMAKKCRVP
jgi:hypothetical protein